MDELLNQFTSSHITLDESDISLKHPRYCELYRTRPDVCNQEKRRKEWLDKLKSKRQSHLNRSRGIELNSHGEHMEVDHVKKKPETREYKGWLMLSEWLIEVPSDIEKNWLCKICPQGIRALVVAELGKTMAYRRNGRLICGEFPSCLPGGSYSGSRGETILDTVFHKSSSTFYVLDVIYWGINTVDFDAEMRFYWLTNKLQEFPLVKEKTKTNRYRFIIVEHFPFLELEERMKKHPIYPGNNPIIDGVLFYHKEGTYVHDRSPLVTWLNPFMIPDILKIDVSLHYLDERPPNYNQMEVENKK